MFTDPRLDSLGLTVLAEVGDPRFVCWKRKASLTGTLQAVGGIVGMVLETPRIRHRE
jgi:hypothetical protein